MPKQLHVPLTAAQVAELVDARDHHPKAYLREKSAAILKIAVEGLPALQVAEHGLLKRRDDNTVRRWLSRYLHEGLAGLLVGRGRGRKPAFSPSAAGRGHSSARGGHPSHSRAAGS
jgi:hypothetical protein